jgi:asparagine synthase (glutamine-hydrolysing)
MPGISFLLNFREDLQEVHPTLLNSLDNLCRGKDYQRILFCREQFYTAASTHYERYPVWSFEREEFLIIIEGIIYNKQSDRVENEVFNLSRQLFNPGGAYRKSITRTLHSFDGDYIILIINRRTNDVAVLNDIFGRLPLYYHKNSDEIIISREIRFIKTLISDFSFDKMAIAQQLLFGYSVGSRTIFSEIYRLEPASVIRINFKERQVQKESFYVFNFDQTNDNDINKNAGVLSDLFSESCRNRADLHGQNIVSLSGGLDSRAVAAGLCKNNIPFIALTRQRWNRIEHRDAELAQQLAVALKINWRLVEVPPPNGGDFLKLLRLKNGLNYLGMAFILHFYDFAKETYGPQITFFTGDGGDKLLPTLKPAKKLKSVDDLVRHIVEENGIFRLQSVSALTGIMSRDIMDDLMKQVLSYPETDCDYKYIHFIFNGRTFNWLFEGEDRARCYFWNVAPFYSSDLFKYSMTCPWQQKTGYALYRQFLMNLSPEATRIDNESFNLPITSNLLPIKLFLRSIFHKLPRPHRTKIKGILRGKSPSYSFNAEIVNCLLDQIESCESIGDYLSESSLRSAIRGCDKTQMEMLLTITSIIEDFDSDDSTLLKYSDIELT